MAHPILTKAIASGVAAGDEVQAVAAYLRELMRLIHGGEWRVDISHESGFVLVTCDVRGDDRCPDTAADIRDMASVSAARGSMLLAKLDREVDAITGTMEEIHGGDWRTSVNHNSCFVSIRRAFPDQRKQQERRV